jgi:hypothetical protein
MPVAASSLRPAALPRRAAAYALAALAFLVALLSATLAIAAPAHVASSRAREIRVSAATITR